MLFDLLWIFSFGDGLFVCSYVYKGLFSFFVMWFVLYE